MQSLALGSSNPRSLPITLNYPYWSASFPKLPKVLLVQGAGREAWNNKTLASCELQTGQCTTLPQPPGTVRLDLALSADGRRLAFVQGEQVSPSPNTPALLEKWQSSLALWVANPDGSNAREVAVAGRGISAPQWSKDGKQLLYARDKALWLLDLERNSVTLLVKLAPARNGSKSVESSSSFTPMASAGPAAIPMK